MAKAKELPELPISLNVNEQAIMLHSMKAMERKAGGNLKVGLNDLISRIQTAQIEDSHDPTNLVFDAELDLSDAFTEDLEMQILKQAQGKFGKHITGDDIGDWHGKLTIRATVNKA
jgi:hypothetical protein